MTLKIPKHVAIIMDGNGRWAKKRGHARIFGHVRGAAQVKPIVLEAQKLGVQALTLFIFSTENWSRPAKEKEVLWKLLKKYLRVHPEELDQYNICLKVIGEVDRLDTEIRQLLFSLLERLSNNTGIKLTFAISYGGRSELVRAAKLFAQHCVDGSCHPLEMNEKKMEEYLWTKELAPVDLFIRTSGEQRISNFLLWQSAYAEFIFSNIYWPDFSPIHFRAAIREYQQRERRFGRLELEERG